MMGSDKIILRYFVCGQTRLLGGFSAVLFSLSTLFLLSSGLGSPNLV
jgi:hypothetical protein